MPLTTSRYGKGRVRVLRLARDGARHTVRELSVRVMLTGGFEAAWTAGDNRGIVATDTIKNIVNALAHDHLAAENEAFASAIAALFLDRYDHVESADVTALETRWTRQSVDGTPHDHGFLLDANGRSTVEVSATRAGATVTSGLDGFTFMKTTEAGWADFHTDEFRTLPDTTDRIVATSMDASWTWSAAPASYERANALVLDTMMRTFLAGYSPGVQNTMYLMGEAVLAAIPEIASVRMGMPNKHYIPIDLARFGRQNRNEVFLPTDEPHGQIEALVTR